jgi:hypothetical protein
LPTATRRLICMTTQSKLEYRIVNIAARSIFSERHLTMEAAEARLTTFTEVGMDENLAIFCIIAPEYQWLADKSQECQQ